MTPERRDLIQRHWQAYRHLAKFEGVGTCFRVPVRNPVFFQGYQSVLPEPLEVLEFWLYRSKIPYCSRRLYGVICEGVCVETEVI